MRQVYLCLCARGEPTFRLLPLYILFILLINMPTDASTAPGGTSLGPQPSQRQGIGSTQAQINALAGDISNTNVNGTVGPNFFVARLGDEAVTLALYGLLKSDKCVLGLQGQVHMWL